MRAQFNIYFKPQNIKIFSFLLELDPISSLM